MCVRKVCGVCEEGVTDLSVLSHVFSEVLYSHRDDTNYVKRSPHSQPLPIACVICDNNLGSLLLTGAEPVSPGLAWNLWIIFSTATLFHSLWFV